MKDKRVKADEVRMLLGIHVNRLVGKYGIGYSDAQLINDYAYDIVKCFDESASVGERK